LLRREYLRTDVVAGVGGLHEQPDREECPEEQRQERAAIEGEGRHPAGRLEAGIAELFTVVITVGPSTARALLRRLFVTGKTGNEF
jgi:hypothetical protein